MSTSLKQELKAWEHKFRQENGRDPNKVDIKQNVEIAKKYKEYSKSKQPTQAPIKQAAPIFKTPTKPRPSTTSRQLTTTTQGDPSTSSDALATTHENGRGGGGGGGSPTKRLSANGKTKEPQYVLANSPSKLRALAAMHSTSGSPNRPSGPNWLTASTSSSSQSSKRTKSISSQPRPSSSSTTMNTSPRKALNPFASPKKRETVVIAPPSRGTTLFLEFEKQELDRIKREKKKKEKGIIKVKGGMGWGHSSDALEIGNNRGSRMELDEVDSFFGSPSTSSTLTKPQDSNPFLSPASALQPQSQSQSQDEEEDDELLGPSPIKPPSQFRRSISSTSFGFDSSKKPFKPLFDDDPLPPQPPPIATNSSQSKAKEEVEMKPPSVRPKLFETSLRTESVEVSNSNSRGLKRTNSSTGGKKAAAGGGGGDEMDGLLDDGEDDFYADAFDALEGKEGEEDSGKKGKGGKRKRVGTTTAAGRGRGRGRGGKGKGKARDEELGEEEGEVDDELRVERDGRGGLVLDLRVDRVEGEEGGEMRERIKVMQQGRDRNRRGNAEGMELDQEEGGEEDEEDLLRDDVSFLSRPQNRSIVSSDRPRQPNSPPPPALGASLPSDLASILSLRASPTKSTETAKDRQVAKLLREPTELARQRRRGGLLELEDEQVGEENEDEEEEIEGDDDWDEEVDGWKQAGDAMDGYYSGREDW